MNDFDETELSEEELMGVTAGTVPKEQVLKEEIDTLLMDASKPGLTDAEKELIRNELERKKEELENIMGHGKGFGM